MLNPSRLSELEKGVSECRTLQETVAVNMLTLVRTIYPSLEVSLEGLSLPKKMHYIAQKIHETHGYKAKKCLEIHPSDLIRGWACYMVMIEDLPLNEAIIALKSLAKDPHPGVREWAWMALRPKVKADPLESIRSLEAFVHDPNPFLKRFAVEVTRPRGVWASHIPLLKQEPWHGLRLLNPLKTETQRYVQNSVANWLNDAGKSQPEWVKEICKKGEWSPYILKRALRNLKQENLSAKVSNEQ